MSTAYDIVKGALELCGAVAPEEAPNASLGSMGLRLLNQMRAQWNAQGVSCYGLQVLTKAVDSSPFYTLGTGGDFATRPLGIQAVNVVNGTDVYPPRQLTFNEFQEQQNPAETGFPIFYAVNPASPQMELYLWPIPTSGTLRVTAQTTFADIANLSDDIPDPDWYLTPLEYGLALLIAPRLGKDLDDKVEAEAGRSFRACAARANPQPPPRVQLDHTLTRTPNRNKWTEVAV